MNKIWEQPMFSLISLEYIQVNGYVVRTRLFGRNAKGHVPLVTSLTANTKLTAKPLMRSIVNGCMYANRHRFTTLPLDRILLEINEVESLDSSKNPVGKI